MSLEFTPGDLVTLMVECRLYLDETSLCHNGWLDVGDAVLLVCRSTSRRDEWWVLSRLGLGVIPREGFKR